MKKILSILKGIIAWVLKNIALITGVLEALGKVIVGIITLTPTKKDDPLIPYVDKVFSFLKKWLYIASDWLMGKL